ncbi:MAG: DUF1059 domain-containing protein [Flavobacteriaceae bacterium]
MKTMTCNQLGGACEKEFHANTFEELAEISKKHGIEMFQQKDSAHIEAVNKMKELMKSPEAMNNWFEAKRKQFDTLADN